jgi:DNA-binding transcriptional LysR family regulator
MDEVQIQIADVAAGRINTFLCPEEGPPSLESEMLFTMDFVCLVGAALPVRARRLTLKQYLEFQHVLVELREGQQALVDRALSQLGAKRRVACTLPFFVPATFAIAQTRIQVARRHGQALDCEHWNDRPPCKACSAAHQASDRCYARRYLEHGS